MRDGAPYGGEYEPPIHGKENKAFLILEVYMTRIFLKRKLIFVLKLV